MKEDPEKPSNIYHRAYLTLLEEYGGQGWWPLSRGRVHPQYHRGEARTPRDRWEVVVGAILTQNTSWTNVERALANLNRKKLTSPTKISRLEESELAELIRPSGYYRQKANRLRTLAQFIVENPLQALADQSDRELRQTLLGQKGIGPETADDILLYAFSRPFFVIDAYTVRIARRWGCGDDSMKYGDWQREFSRHLPEDVDLYQEYHALLVEHAKMACTRRYPQCESCCLRDLCSFPEEG